MSEKLVTVGEDTEKVPGHAPQQDQQNQEKIQLKAKYESVGEAAENQAQKALGQKDYYAIKKDPQKFLAAMIQEYTAYIDQAEAEIAYIEAGGGEYTNRDFAVTRPQGAIKYFKERIEEAKNDITNQPDYKNRLTNGAQNMDGLIGKYSDKIIELNLADEKQFGADKSKTHYPHKFDNLSGVAEAAFADGDNETLQKIGKIDGKVGSGEVGRIKLPDQIKQKIGLAQAGDELSKAYEGQKN